MKIWYRYKSIIKQNCTDPQTTQQELRYWRNKMFASLLIYIIPLCFIALMPSLYWVFKIRMLNVAAIDFITVLSVIIVAFIPGISVQMRKLLFFAVLYIFSFSILFFVGIGSSSVNYLLAGSVLSVLIFQNNYKYWSVWLNCVFCVVYGICIYFKFLPITQPYKVEMGEWVAISMNFIFLSFLFVVLVPKLFDGLQTVIFRQIELQNELVNEKNELKNTLQLLSHKNTELEHFSFIASHDLQEPLRMITGFLTQIKNKFNDKLDEKGRQYIFFAVEGAMRMHRIIQDLLEYSRAGKIEGEKEDINVQQLFDESIKLFEPQIRKLNASVLAADLPVIISHRTMIEKVFQNLLGNALKYHSESRTPTIKVSAKEEGTHWLFSFKDNGIGIDAEFFEKIFVIFQRLHQSNEYSGSGVGLAIVKKIVDYLGGTIWVESKEGEGSCFYFTILK